MRNDAAIARLSGREKGLLRLLAAGHTVKSAAAITGDSENAAAELLRAARRKLGVGSSREAARLLSLAEDRSQEIGDGISRVSPQAPGAHDVEPSGQRRILVMATAITAAIAAAVLGGLFGGSSADAAPPRVVRSSPGAGAVIEPGPFTLSVTFDRKMQPTGYSFATGPEAQFPACDGKVRAEPDGRTFSMRCRAEPGRRYVVWANHGRFLNFRAVDGTPALPGRITFAVRPR